ncbi:hypothetical protein LVB87_14115 [Lysobacter sp. KIS68-7]|uniref:hypothetical protein n=1 Tax=Lysobacter sp. KIS68-7 TaxID=2904252 RepID=UPI001E594A91|nr:hypothetical protein [Lysobacter sp. KIS68-7]UHQ19302.1 hypothetical protein LVB87_14115 [Lysobacter sp. KIS68-7]
MWASHARGLVACLAMVLASNAFAQEDVLGPPDALQFPTQASADAPNGVTGPFLRKTIEDTVDVALCEALMRNDGRPIPADFTAANCDPAYAAKVRNREGSVHWASASARPLQCGGNCVGRPFMTQSQRVGEPNLREAMLYGHIDLTLDGPVDRSLTYFFEAHIPCKASNGAKTGNVDVRFEIGDPVVGSPGVVESILDFLLLPARLSDRIDAGIRAMLSSVPGTSQEVGACRSVGVGLSTGNPQFDNVVFDKPVSAGGRRPLADLLLRGDRVKVEFLSITRHPLPGPPLVAPEHAQPGNPAAGYFTAYLNGVPVGFPVPLNMSPEALQLPPEGGTIALNYCKTLPIDGWDRLQVIFGNGLGGAVWSQFPRAQGFGQGVPRRMTTGRGIVVPGLPGPNGTTKPQSVTLREFELLYRITFLPAPAFEAVSEGGGRRPPRGSVTGELGERPPLVSDGAPGPVACREI